MENKKRYSINKILLATLWISISAGIIVLLVAAMRKEDKQLCTGMNVTIKGVSNNFFVDKNDILKAINEYVDGKPEGQPISFFNLKSLETELQKNIWVKKAQLFFDNNLVLQVTVLEREPVARIFTTAGTTFYIDSSIAMLPLSEKFSARLPVFTNFPSDKKVLAKEDSTLLRDIYSLSTSLQQDAFSMAMTDQVDITAQRSFELVPKIGNTIIVFGDATNATEKLNKLQLFYKEVMMKAGWDHYSKVDVQYAGQVVAKRKGAEGNTTDSLRTLQIMQLVAMDAELRASDSLQTIAQDNEHNTTDVNLILQSMQRDDDNEKEEPIGIPVLPKPTNPVPMKNNPSVKKPAKHFTAAVKTNNKPVAKKIVAAKPVTVGTKPATNNAKPKSVTSLKPRPAAAKPKVLMPKKNEY